MTEKTTELAALEYLERCWSLIPVVAKDKRPVILWKAWQDRRVSIETLHEWFIRSPDFNVAVVTGRSSGLVLLDVEPRHADDDSLEELEAEHGLLPTTVDREPAEPGQHSARHRPPRRWRLHRRAAVGAPVRQTLSLEEGLCAGPLATCASARVAALTIEHEWPEEGCGE